MSDQVADKLEEEAQVRLEVARELKEEKRKRWKLEDQVTELQKECSKVQLQLDEKKRACDKAKCEAEDERVLRHDAEYNLEAFEKELRRSKVRNSLHTAWSTTTRRTAIEFGDLGGFSGGLKTISCTEPSSPSLPPS